MLDEEPIYVDRFITLSNLDTFPWIIRFLLILIFHIRTVTKDLSCTHLCRNSAHQTCYLPNLLFHAAVFFRFRIVASS